MRIATLILAFVVGVPSLGAAQDWAEYTSIQDGFRVDFPGTPTITDTTWKSQLDYVLPGRVYVVQKGKERYSMTVIDYHPLEQQGIDRAAKCPEGNAQCRQNAGIMGPGYWRHDERGAIVYATSKILQRDVKLTSLAWEWQDMVEGHFLQVTNNADQSRMCIRDRGYPEPGLFQQSLSWVDKDGKPIRYQQIIYSNAYHGMGVYPVPPVGGGGPASGAAAAPPAGGGGR